MPKVLIIDDRRENIIFIANNILKPMGYDVVTARDGESGLHKAQEKNLDLIITDLKLPKLHGLEILERLRAEGNHTPAIVMTFHGTEETAVRAMRLGARDYLIKPFTFEEMQEALDRVFKPAPYSNNSNDQQNVEQETKIKLLEEELAERRSMLAKREMQLEQLQRQLTGDESGQQMAASEQENAKLHKMLGQAKYALRRVIQRANAMEEMVVAQQRQTSKYRQEAQRLAEQLRNLSEAMRLMSQDMEHQVGRLAAVRSKDRK